MLTKVIVILLICYKLDYTTSLPDIIRIGEEFSFEPATTKKILAEKRKSFFHATQGVAESVLLDARSRSSRVNDGENKTNIRHGSSNLSAVNDGPVVQLIDPFGC